MTVQSQSKQGKPVTCLELRRAREAVQRAEGRLAAIRADESRVLDELRAARVNLARAQASEQGAWTEVE